MISFKPVVHAHRRRRDGTYPVTIRVTFARKTRYLPTTITVTAADMTRSLKIKNTDVIAHTNAICDRLRQEAAALNPFDLEGRDVDWVVRRLTEAMRRQDFQLDFFSWSDEFLRSKGESNRAKYDTSLRAFERFLGKRSIDINDITHALLIEFADYCDSGNKLSFRKGAGVKATCKPRTRPISPHYLSHLRHVFDAAKDRYNDEDGGAVVIPRSPFRKLKMTPPPPDNAPEPLPVEVIQMLIDDADATGHVRQAVDAFIVSFGLMGVNMADLYEATPPKGEKWRYFRRKTRRRRADHAEMIVLIPAVLRPFLRRLGAGSSSEWWLPVLHERGKTSSIAGMAMNKGLRRWCELHGVEPFTFGSARHSWATLGRRFGIEKATVDEGLAHVGEFRITDIYAERDWDNIAEANRRILAMFRWPDDKK